MKTSRAYQLAIENEIPLRLRDHGATIVQAPTGSGKSHIINRTVQRICRAGKIALVLSDNIKIHAQLAVECNGHTIDSKVKFLEILQGECYVAMTQSLRNRHAILQQFKALGNKVVVIVDECHRNTMTPLVEEISPSFLVGFSATPHWKLAKHLPRLYKSLIHGPQISQLIQEGFLAHYKHIIRTGADLDQLEKKGGEYTEESQNRVFGSKKLFDGLFEDLPVYRGKKTCIYVASIKMCEQLYEQLLERGYKVCRYHSKLQDAAYELSKFTTHNTCDIIISVASLTLGWDYPPIDTIVLWRKTGSLPLYLQMCGRGGRGCEGKESFTVLDYGSNWEEFGGWAMDRDWNELWQEPKKRRSSVYDGVAGSKECPVCAALLSVSARSCYNCGYMYPETEMRLVEGRLLEVQNTLEALKNRRISSLTAEELALHARLNQKKAHCIRVAKSKEQRQPGFLAEFASALGYSSGWVKWQLENMSSDPIEFADVLIS